MLMGGIFFDKCPQVWTLTFIPILPFGLSSNPSRPSQWAAATRYAGFKLLWYRETAHEKLEELGIREKDLSFTTRGLYSFARCRGYLFVRFNLPRKA